MQRRRNRKPTSNACRTPTETLRPGWVLQPCCLSCMRRVWLSAALPWLCVTEDCRLSIIACCIVAIHRGATEPLAAAGRREEAGEGKVREGAHAAGAQGRPEARAGRQEGARLRSAWHNNLPAAWCRMQHAKAVEARHKCQHTAHTVSHDSFVPSSYHLAAGGEGGTTAELTNPACALCRTRGMSR